MECFARHSACGRTATFFGAGLRLWATFSIGPLSRRPGAEFLSCQRRSRKFKVARHLCPVDFSTHRIENVFRVETIGASDPLRPAIFVRRHWVSSCRMGLESYFDPSP